MTAAQVYSQLQTLARSRKRPSDEIFVLYALERFLVRLSDTSYANDFCLKGGVLLSAHALRRPTRDVDIQALNTRTDRTPVTSWRFCEDAGPPTRDGDRGKDCHDAPARHRQHTLA